MLPSRPINKADILNAEKILGPNLESLKGKLTRTTPSKVLSNALDDLPTKLLEQHKKVTLGVDIMFVNKIIPFMIMTSGAIHFGMAEMIKKEKNLL